MATALEVDDYRRVFRFLEHVQESRAIGEFKNRVIEALHREFGLRNSTFFTGPSYGALFEDPDPMLYGRTVALFDEYRSDWVDYDVFQLDEARVKLEQSGVLSAHDLTVLPEASRMYLRDFLGRRGVADVGTLYLRHSDGHSLVGMFAVDVPFSERDLQVLGVIAKQLTVFGRNLPHDLPSHVGRLDRLTPRQRDVAALVAQGMSNAEIAATLVIAEDTVKKHVSHVLSVTGCRSRTELALYMR
jgi:DNA-binding CsgD family transcriptional regulator